MFYPDVGGVWHEEGAATGDSQATTLTTGAAHTKGTAVAIGSATSYNASGFTLTIVLASEDATDPRDYFLDVSIDSAASYIIAEDLAFCVGDGNAFKECKFSVYLPIHVPKGVTLYCRAQATQASATVDVQIHYHYTGFGGFKGFALCRAHGITAATTRVTDLDPGSVTPHTKGSYTELAATTDITRNVHAVMLGFGNTYQNASWTSGDWLVDLAIGTGNQIVIADYHVNAHSTNDCMFVSMSPVWPIGPIPSGTAIKARCQSNLTNIDRFCPIVLYTFE